MLVWCSFEVNKKPQGMVSSVVHEQLTIITVVSCRATFFTIHIFSDAIISPDTEFLTTSPGTVAVKTDLISFGKLYRPHQIRLLRFACLVVMLHGYFPDFTEFHLQPPLQSGVRALISAENCLLYYA
jgi:hypothetical protein